MVKSTLFSSCCLFLLSLGAVALPSVQEKRAKAVYFMSNKVGGNSIHALKVNSKGFLSSGRITPTGGKGSRAPAPFLTDALNSQGSLVVSGHMLFACNAGSNTVSMFMINKNDPLKLTLLGKPVDTMGDFPNSIAASDTLKMICVSNTGKRSGVACFRITYKGLEPLDKAQRPLTLMPRQSNPPTGPFNTISQTFFDHELKGLITMVKGDPTAKPATVGYMSYFPITEYGMVSRHGTQSSPHGTAVLFGSVALPKNRILATDASFGAAFLRVNPKTHKAETLYKHTIPRQSATCWAVQSPATGLIYTTDDGIDQIGAFDPVNGHSVALTKLKDGNPNLIEITAVGSLLYALSHGNSTHKPRVVVIQTQGPSGRVKTIQNFVPGNGGLRINVDGLAILV